MKYRRRTFTDEEIEIAKGMRARGVAWRTLAATFDCDYETVRRVIDPGFREFRAQQIKVLRRPKLKGRGPIPFVVPVAVPDQVLADRERRVTAPRSLTAILCGDPPAGQSALDKRGAGA